MSRMATITPKDLVLEIQAIVLQHRGEWISPKQVWDELCHKAPDLAAQVDAKVCSYKNPERNNHVWFVSNALWHVAKDPRFQLSDVENVPEMKGKAYWEIIRAKPL